MNDMETPQEIQQNLFKKLKKNPGAINSCSDEKCKNTFELVDEAIDTTEKIKKNPFIHFEDNGIEMNMTSEGFSKPAIVGILYVMLRKFSKEIE